MFDKGLLSPFLSNCVVNDVIKHVLGLRDVGVELAKGINPRPALR